MWQENMVQKGFIKRVMKRGLSGQPLLQLQQKNYSASGRIEIIYALCFSVKGQY